MANIEATLSGNSRAMAEKLPESKEECQDQDRLREE